MTFPRFPLPAGVGLMLALAFATTTSAEPIRFARTPDISPDGKMVAFSYLGDIWTVPAEGGTARLITMHQAHEFLPIFSPDGSKIAFASRRHGQYDVFVISSQGGKPTRLTFDSADDYPCGWSPDGKYVLFSSRRTPEYPPREELYRVPVTGGREERITWTGGREGIYSPDGKEIAYVRGPGTWYRKGYRGSSNDDIWICAADGKNHRQLTHFPGQDGYPSWSLDRKAVYYVSETLGPVANIVRQEIGSGPGEPLTVRTEPRRVTFHKVDGVRRARLSRNGEWLVYECGADLYIVSGKGGVSRKLNIEAFADYKNNPERTETFTEGASEFAVSPDERFIAFAIHGEIFLMGRGGGKARRLTQSAAYDHGLAWSPDSKKLIFLSDRGGHEDAYELLSDDPDHPQLVQAHRFKVKQLTNTPQAEIGLNFSPDGKRISFLREGRLITMSPDGTGEKVIVGEPMVIDYEWSPDSKWLCYARLDGSYASELYVIAADGTGPVHNITRYATYNAAVTWSKFGNRLAFLSERGLGTDRNVIVMALQKPATPDAKPTSDIDWDNIHLRVKRLSPMGASEPAISPNGKLVAFRAEDNGAEDLWVAEVDGSSVKRLTTGNLRPAQIRWSNLLASLIYFRDAKGTLRMVTLGDKEALKVPFQAQLTIQRDEEYLEIFDQCWRSLNENFYDPRYHGADWKAVKEKYRPLVKHVAVEEDLHALISLMLGELNASHLGIKSDDQKPESVTADLGLIFDDAFPGPGLKIKEILRRGPADRRGLKLDPGDVIVKLDGIALTDQVNLPRLLNGKAGEAVALEVTSDPTKPGSLRRVELYPTNRKVAALLLYDRWVEHNTSQVTALSKGRLGYIHIPAMDQQGLDRFVRSLYSENFDKEAIVLDVRFNGGGYTHDKVLNYLGGTNHTFFLQRHGGKGTVFRAADRKWSKPVILLINNYSFSDAEIFPHAFRTLGLGRLVGVATGGMVIGTYPIKLIDGSTFRIPRTGIFTANGINLERKGVQPDIVVENQPDQLLQGMDAQLERAVTALLEDVGRWKDKHKGVAQGPNLLVPAPAPEARPGANPRAPGASSLRK
jgi:tricorn protease